MASRGKRKKSRGPRFPRRKWDPGQKPRIEKPKKGKGSYDRTRENRQDEEETM
jgi:stalled ribosome alternative rescue factor ArfA